MSNPPTEENIFFEESLRYHLYPEPEPDLNDVDANDTEWRLVHDHIEAIEEEEDGEEEDGDFMDTGMYWVLQMDVWN